MLACCDALGVSCRVPGQIAPRVVGMQSAAEIERVIKDALHAARAEMSKMGDAIQVVADGAK